MKKLIAIALAALLTLSMIACTKTEAPAAPTAAPSDAGSGTYDPNKEVTFEMQTSEEKRIVTIGTPDASKYPGPILVTSFGQSADSSMLDAIMKKTGAEYTFKATATADDVKDYGTVIIASGASSKGLGAAGISEADETKRAQGVIDAIKENNIPVIACHLGGGIRRGTLSDSFTNMALEVCSYIVVVEDGNYDGLFTNTATEKDIPITMVFAIADSVQPFKDLFVK